MANESEWTSRVAAWRESGRSAAEFCADKGYSASTLYYRASQLKRCSDSNVPDARVSIARVVRKAAGSPSTAAPIVVQIGLARVEVAAGVDRTTLSDVLRALTSGAWEDRPRSLLASRSSWVCSPNLEKLAQEGKIVRHGFEDSVKLLYKRGGKRRVIIARVRYKAVDAEGNTDVITAAMPPEMIPSAIAAPSMLAHILVENIAKGMPLFRMEESFERDGIGIDRGTMSRWKKQIGEKLAQTVVLAMQNALATAFCIATDATGVNVQPIYSRQKGRQPCQKSHFLVMAADRDHLLYEYLEKENGRAIYSRFRGFSGYVQADAKSVFNLLFADPGELATKAPELEHDGCTRSEVGCWYHCRRRMWEAAVAKSVVGREGLVRIGQIFELDESWKKKPPSEIKRLREQHLRPHVESFFAWVDEQRAIYRDQRGYARTALEYANNQRDALQRSFEDGKLVLSNNGAERALKTIATGRKAWLFCGSDDHARSTTALFSIVASARLHGLDLEEYLRCLIRIVPLWPEDRMLELAPLFWSRTRARLDADQLEAEIGWLTIPSEPLDTSASTEQPTTS